MKNKMQDLRNHLFISLERLQEEENPENLEKEIQRSKAIVNVSKTLIDSAKEETRFLEVAAGNPLGTGFMTNTPEPSLIPHKNK